MLVDAFLRSSAELSGHRTALVCQARRLTYAELDSAVDRVAAGLRQHGVQKGDRVAIALENSVDAVLALFGTLRAGGVIVPLNAGIKAEKLGYILGDCEPAVLVADRRIADAFLGTVELGRPPVVVLADAIPTDDVSDLLTLDGLMASNSDPLEDVRRIDLDLAAIIYTSGSTGIPKGVVLSHANIVAATTSINGYLQHTPDDIILNVLPLSFDYGLYQLFLAAQSAACVVLERSFAYPTLILQTIAQEQATTLPIVPMMAAILLRRDISGHDLSCIRRITNTGAALPPAHIAALRDRFPLARLFSMYGLTECKRVSFLDPSEVDARPTSVGKPMDNVEVFVESTDGALQSHGTGQLVVRGSNVMQGYWRAPSETALVIRQGVLGDRLLRTGDVFTIDEEGYLYFRHRMDDVIKKRGEKVSPKEIEDGLLKMKEIAQAAVIGVPSPVAGQSIKAFVSLKPGALVTKSDVLRHCSTYLEDLLIPDVIEFREAFPLNSNGKIDKLQLVQTSGEPAQSADRVTR